MPAAALPTPSGPLKFEAFDGLRAVAATLVIAYHVSLFEGLTHAGVLASLASELKGGVTVFFVISGFLLYLPYARAIRDGDPLPSWRSYARRRAVRILPGYWVALTILGVASLAGSVFTGAWWSYYGLAYIYNPATLIGGLGVSWSLCVEATFYLCLPFFARWMAALVRRDGTADAARSQVAVVGALGLVSILLRGAVCDSLIGPVSPTGAVLETALPGALDWFAIGIALAVIAAAWETSPERFRPVSRLAANWPLSWALAGVLYAVGAREQQGDLFLPLYGVFTHVALGLASAFLVLPAIRRGPRTGAVRILSTRFVAWLGMISYGVYLWHDSVLKILKGSGAPPSHAAGIGQAIVLFLATAAGAIVLGAGSWYLVERPAQRLFRRRRPGPGVAIARKPGLTQT
ncbi:MAG TPA: acyltransferase [Solirubrobacteraceae bacterium]|jgi:peptidoglycan/LPS O-acetylase OafA/YrhL